MPYREKPEVQFDSHIHTHDRGDSSFVNNSVLDNDALAEYEAELRNSSKKWYQKLFGRKISGVDITREQAVAEYVDGLKYDKILKKIVGQFNGVPLNIRVRDFFDKVEGARRTSYVDGEEITAVDAEFIFNKLRPLLEEHEKNVNAAEARPSRSEKASKAITRLLGPRTSAHRLPPAGAPKQLEAHKGEEE